MPKERTANALAWWRPLETTSLQINTTVIYIPAGISVKMAPCSRKLPVYFQVNFNNLIFNLLM